MRILKIMSCLLATSLTLVAAPKLDVASERVNLGDLTFAQKTADATFTLRNAGDSPLSISNVRLTCGCLAYELPKTSLRPGESTNLVVTLSVPENSYGQIVKHVYVTSNSDPAMRRLTLTGQLPDAPKTEKVEPAEKEQRIKPDLTNRKTSNIVAIDAKQLRQLASSIRDVSDIRILDTRTPSEFQKGSVKHAISFPETEWRRGPTEWPQRSVLIVIAENEELSQNQAHLFASWGYRIVMRLEGGYPAVEATP